jgi:hypothetical protein
MTVSPSGMRQADDHRAPSPTAAQRKRQRRRRGTEPAHQFEVFLYTILEGRLDRSNVERHDVAGRGRKQRHEGSGHYFVLALVIRACRCRADVNVKHRSGRYRDRDRHRRAANDGLGRRQQAVDLASVHRRTRPSHTGRQLPRPADGKALCLQGMGRCSNAAFDLFHQERPCDSWELRHQIAGPAGIAWLCPSRSSKCGTTLSARAKQRPRCHDCDRELNQATTNAAHLDPEPAAGLFQPPNRNRPRAPSVVCVEVLYVSKQKRTVR